MITLITGLPGSGKSLAAVAMLVDQHKAGGRPVYACGVDGLDESLAHTLDDPLTWQSLPEGSLIVVDEAQKHFPARRMQDPLPPVKDLSEHRHGGYDFILVTQHPSMIDTYVRRLVGAHIHVSRKWGLQGAEHIAWNECVDDVQSDAMRQRASRKTVKYNPSLYTKYKSATLHTVKRKLPLALIALPFVLVAAAGMIWWGYQLLYGAQSPTPAQQPAKRGAAAPAAAPPGRSLALGETARKPVYANAAEYAAAHTPRVPSMPWSAPAFDGRRVTANPDILCIQIGERECRCYTEQVTRMLIDRQSCLRIARHGIYNPYRERERQRDDMRPDDDAAERPAGRPHAVASADSAAVAPGDGYASPAQPAHGVRWVLGPDRSQAH